MGYRVFLELGTRRYFQNVKNMVSRSSRWRGHVRRLQLYMGSGFDGFL